MHQGGNFSCAGCDDGHREQLDLFRHNQHKDDSVSIQEFVFYFPRSVCDGSDERLRVTIQDFHADADAYNPDSTF